MERRIVLLGKTGSVKSATGNTILRGNYFQARACSSSSSSSRCNMQEVGRIRVVDTPGMFDTSMTPDQLISEIAQCVCMSVPGPHVFLLVIRLGRFTEEDKNALKWIQEILGEDASLYTIVLFTHADQLRERTLEKFLAESPELRRLLNTCGNRYHAFNNNDPDPSQVNHLMQKIDAMVKMNGGKYYTNEMYENDRRIKEHDKRAKMQFIADTIAAAAAGICAVAVIIGSALSNN